jgi:hypothetical protein
MRIRTLLLITVFFATAVSAPSAVAVAPSVSWFREKYLTQIYNEYYTYTLTRWRMEDNDRDVCPDTHTPAVYFAITGQQLWHHQPRDIIRLPRVSVLPPRRPPRPLILFDYTAHDIHLIRYTVGDAAFFLLEFTKCCCELLMLLLSILMAIFTTIILMMLVFEP